MSTVHETAVQVQPKPDSWDFEVEGDVYHPSPEEEAFDSAYRLARDGDLDPLGWPALDELAEICGNNALIPFLTGRDLGYRTRRVTEARELGVAVGRLGLTIEPSRQYSSEEAAAYREGRAAGLAEFEADLAFEAWVAEQEANRMADAFPSVSLTDQDVYPPGCWS